VIQTAMTDAPAPAAHDLLAEYQPGAGFLFASPKATLLAEGTYFAVPPSVRPGGLVDLPARAAAALDVAHAAGHPDPIVVGAIPFDPDTDAHLVVPQQVRRTGPASAASGAWSPPKLDVTPEPAQEDYVEAVAKAVRRIRAGELTKVVLARSLRLTGAGRPDVAALARRLAWQDPHGYLFATDLPGGSTLFGLTPELLVSRRGRLVLANPLAGSAARTGDSTEDTRRAAALLASAKDRQEHAIVVASVRDALSPLCSRVTVPEEPTIVSTATMLHLSTVVTGELADERTTALALAVALHPTPAVCGTPTDIARATIAELEPVDRGFYTGMVGWTDAHGDGEWAVTIRCGVADADALRLYAGAGIVADSDPAAELAETTAKFATLLRGLGL
jgi:isochorismate synthase